MAFCPVAPPRTTRICIALMRTRQCDKLTTAEQIAYTCRERAIRPAPCSHLSFFLQAHTKEQSTRDFWPLPFLSFSSSPLGPGVFPLSFLCTFFFIFWRCFPPVRLMGLELPSHLSCFLLFPLYVFESLVVSSSRQGFTERALDTHTQPPELCSAPALFSHHL